MYSSLGILEFSYVLLPYGVAVYGWITSCHKNRITTSVITLWRVDVTSLTSSTSTMRFHIEIMFILKAIKSHFKVVIIADLEEKQKSA